VDNLGKTVDNLTQVWITWNVYSIIPRAGSRPHPHIWGVRMFHTQITQKLDFCSKSCVEPPGILPRYPQFYSAGGAVKNRHIQYNFSRPACMCGEFGPPAGLSTYPQPLLLTTKPYTFYKRVKNFDSCFSTTFPVQFYHQDSLHFQRNLSVEGILSPENADCRI
jgi:hypothetical protein